MSFKETTCSYEINIKFMEATLKNDGEENLEDVKLELVFMGQKFLMTSDDQLFLSNGVQNLDIQFNLNKNESELTNGDFNFHALGDQIEVNLVKYFPNTKKSVKKPRDAYQPVVIASGSINLLTDLEQFQKTGNDIFSVELKANEDTFDACFEYQVSFFNVPSINWTLALEVSQIINFELEPEETPKLAFHFPIDASCYRTAFLHKAPKIEEITDGFIIHKSLKNYEVLSNSFQSNVKYHCKNILTASGFNNLGEIIKQHGVLLLEIKTKKKTFMAFIELNVFNYEGVKKAQFLAPIYYRNKNVIMKRFQQDLSAFTEAEVPGKKKVIPKEESKNEVEAELVQVANEEKFAAVMIKFTLYHSQKPETKLEDLKLSLNHSFPFIENISRKDEVVIQTEKDFVQAVLNSSEEIQKFIDEHPDLDSDEVTLKIREAIEKNELTSKQRLKRAMIDFIGNKLNVDVQTETNNEFKISMIPAFKSLNQEMMSVLFDREARKNSLSNQVPLETLKLQAEEWMLMGQPEKAEAIYLKLLDYEKNVEILESYSIFLLRNGKLQECSEKVNQLLKMDDGSVIGFYLLAYLKTDAEKLEEAILCMKILVKMSPDNLEFWILLMTLYLKNNEDQCGVDFCSLNLISKKFVNNQFCSKPLMFIDLNTENDLANVLNFQLKNGLKHFVKMTKEFMSLMPAKHLNLHDNLQLQLIEMTIEGMVQEVGEVLNTVELNDENEIFVRIFKGNSLHDSGKSSEAIDEYEISFNLCLKANKPFPHLLALRCGDWYIKAGILSKARRYFHYVCKRSPTFNSWMGLGIVCFQETNYSEAEKYFNEANKIDNESGDNWIYLALCNFHLQRQDSFEKCVQISQKFKVDNSLMEIVEKILDY